MSDKLRTAADYEAAAKRAHDHANELRKKAREAAAKEQARDDKALLVSVKRWAKGIGYPTDSKGLKATFDEMIKRSEGPEGQTNRKG